MSLKSVVQQLRVLPYTEMKALAEQVAKLLEADDAKFRVEIADVLSSLPTITNEELDTEQKILADFFRKKRSITITTASGANGPWTIACSDGIRVSNASIRGACSEFLDALAAYHALRK